MHFALPRRFALLFIGLMSSLILSAQAIPESMEYYMLYEFVDELVMDGIVVRQTAVKPYTRGQIADMLREAMTKDSLLSPRQREELDFYRQDFALELDTIPDYTIYGHRNLCQWKRTTGEPVGKPGSAASKADFNLALVEPSLHLKTPDNKFKMMIRPILGMDIDYGKKGLNRHQWFGAEIRMDIVKHIAVWGSLRDNSYYGQRLDKGTYLLNRPGLQYKEATNPAHQHVGDYSDMRGGISAYAWWGSISIQREPVRWGEAYHASNILSGHNPAVPMLSLQLTPCRWFQFDYFHAWLNSNVLDSTNYYVERSHETEWIRHYRPAKKYMAANMLTFVPCKYVSFSLGNSIVYGESTIQAAYFIPIAFYKSLDHLLTKGVNSENQNSQVFGSISVRPVDHLQLYASVYFDEFSFGRLKKSNPEHNPVSYIVGFNWSGWPVRGLSLKAEFLRTNTACYTHSIDQLNYTSNSYGMGHYMGDNAQSIFAELAYRPVRGLSLKLNYTHDTKYNSFDYIRREIDEIIAYKPFDEKIFANDVVGFSATYEVFQNVYARVALQYNNARAYAPASERRVGEDRGWNADGTSLELAGDELEAYYLNKYCPEYYQGKNLTFTCGLNFAF